jgi:hypothetical protein
VKRFRVLSHLSYPGFVVVLGCLSGSARKIDDHISLEPLRNRGNYLVRQSGLNARKNNKKAKSDQVDPLAPKKSL